MDHNELVRKHHTPDDQISPEMRERIARIKQVGRERREAGEYVSQKLGKRHLSENVVPSEPRKGSAGE